MTWMFAVSELISYNLASGIQGLRQGLGVSSVASRYPDNFLPWSIMIGLQTETRTYPIPKSSLLPTDCIHVLIEIRMLEARTWKVKSSINVEAKCQMVLVS